MFDACISYIIPSRMISCLMLILHQYYLQISCPCMDEDVDEHLTFIFPALTFLTCNMIVHGDVDKQLIIINLLIILLTSSMLW